jgi:Asp/Glu/hydantoin racemase
MDKNKGNEVNDLPAIGLIHATLNSVQPILEAFKQNAPNVKLLNFMDEGLIDELNQTNIVTESMVEQLVSLMKRAESRGVDGILLTCSSFSPYVEAVKDTFSVPVLSADIAMLEHAIDLSNRIGVIATIGAAGPTTTKLLEEISGKNNKEIDIETHVLTDAFTALQQGDTNKHNRLIRDKILELSKTSDVIVLAQMSMCRALQGWDESSKPVLTSPEISIKKILSEIIRIQIS